MATPPVRVIHVPYTAEQDEDGAWCAAAHLRPGSGAVGDGPTREAAVADLQAGLGFLIEETGTPDTLPITLAPRTATQGAPPRRIDYHDDPAAPPANSLVPSVNVAAVNPAGDLLLIRRTDNGNWALPGGAVDPGESLIQAAVRETREETEIECEVTGISGIYSDPGHVILYTSDGEVRQEFSVVLTARALHGQPTLSSETSQVSWVPAHELPGYPMDASMRVRIRDFLAPGRQPVLR